MKKVNLLLLAIFTFGLSYGAASGAGQRAYPATVQAYLLPHDANEAKRELMSLLDSAQHEIFIAMYYLTEQQIIDKIIDIKRRNPGINLQVIFDESSPGSENVFKKFRRSNITPIVFPSEAPDIDTLMHDKFIVVDGQKVWTGSANFTGKAMSPDPKGRFNHENIVVIDLPAVATKFKEGFNNAKMDTFDLYIDLLANYNPEGLPEHIEEASVYFYQNDDSDFVQILRNKYAEFSESQRERLRLMFSDLEDRLFPRQTQRFQVLQPQRTPTERQRAFLESRRLYEAGMNFDEASQLIGQVIQRESQQRQRQQQAQQQRPASDYQRVFLQQRGRYRPGMSYDEAYQLIGQLMKQGPGRR